MQTTYTSKQLKSQAKGQLIGHYTGAIGAEVTAFSLIFCLSLFSSSMTDPYSLLGLIFRLAITFIISLLQSIFLFGLTKYYLNTVTAKTPKLVDILSGFSSHADRIILAKLFLMLLEAVCLIPFIASVFVYLHFRNPLLFVLACFLFVCAIIGLAFIGLTYSQIYYLFLDFPQAGVKQILRMSREMMKGNKARLLYIEISFIPYDILGLLSLGIAYLWITPFKRMVRTHFYLSSI